LSFLLLLFVLLQNIYLVGIATPPPVVAKEVDIISLCHLGWFQSSPVVVGAPITDYSLFHHERSSRRCMGCSQLLSEESARIDGSVD
jgi:hypothetical protein